MVREEKQGDQLGGHDTLLVDSDTGGSDRCGIERQSQERAQR